MKPLVLAVAFTALFAAPSSALSPQGEAYLQKIGVDPRSDAVATAEADGNISTVFRNQPQEFSLSGLIGRSNTPNGVKAFIATRAFVAKLKQDFDGTPMLKTNYDAIYLTPEERRLVARKIISTM